MSNTELLDKQQSSSEAFMIKVAEENELAQWQELPFLKKMEVVDSWTFVIILGNFCHILGLIFFVVPDEYVSVTYET